MESGSGKRAAMAATARGARSTTKASCCTKLAKAAARSTKSCPAERPRLATYCHTALETC
eukprot:4260940-Lingulodinium_polyedra.AAC.1